MEFPYKQIGNKFYPIIPLILTKGNLKEHTFALIDSGGEVSIFNVSVANKLGINFRATSDFRYMQGIVGKLLVYLHTIGIKINEKEIICKIGFSPDYHASFNLLGRQGFFENFKITFDEKNNKIFLE